jgi:hypothetical protein
MQPVAEPERLPVGHDREDLGVQVGQPDGRRGRGGGQVDADAVVVQQVHDLVEPAELVPAGLGFE